MKIRDKLLLSYLFMIVIFMLISFYFTYTVPGEITERSSQTTEEAANIIIDKNITLSESVLTSYAERIVELRAEDVAEDVHLILGKTDRNSSRDVITTEKFRKVILHNIRTYNGEIAGYFDLFDNEGNSLIHPNPNVEGKNYREWAKEFPGMWKLVEKSFSTPIVKGYYDFIDENNKKTRKYMVLVQVKDTPFIVSASVNIEAYFLPIQNQIREMINETISEVKKVTGTIELNTVLKLRNTAMGGGVLLLVIGFIIALLLSNSISKPVALLRDGVQQLGKGNFTTTVPEDGSQEIVELSHCFNELGKELTSHMERLKAETAARQSLESEIKIARRIQSTMLPDKFPINDKFEIFARLEPAKEVSGDFFDIFFVNDETMVVLIGDVSGKGIPASIFMALTAAALKSTCKRITHSPAKALKETNRFLQDYEEACMFITVFLGYYNINTGELLYANAGHNKAILLNDKGKSRLFGSFGDVALGALPDFDYKEETYKMQVNESVVLYTDGITEAVSAENEEFGIDRLCSLMEADSSLSLTDMSETVLKALSDFQGENQFDDITFMMLRRRKTV